MNHASCIATCPGPRTLRDRLDDVWCLNSADWTHHSWDRRLCRSLKFEPSRNIVSLWNLVRHNDRPVLIDWIREVEISSLRPSRNVSSSPSTKRIITLILESVLIPASDSLLAELHLITISFLALLLDFGVIGIAFPFACATGTNAGEEGC